MQFKLSETDRYWWPVTVHVPDPEAPGKLVAQSFKAQFEPLSPEEEARASEDLTKISSAREVIEHGIRQAERVVKNWDGVVDADGGPVPFTPEVLRTALKKSWFRIGLNKALQESLNGEEARLGN